MYRGDVIMSKINKRNSFFVLSILIEELCEQVIDASYRGEDLKKEYQLVTDYLTDIQKIEEYLLAAD